MLPPKNIWDIIEILNRVKPLRSPYSIPFFSIEMVAQYYEVEKDTIYKVIGRNKHLVKDYILYLRGSDLALFKEANYIPKNTAILKLVPYEAILMIGVLLNDSYIADTLKDEVARSVNKEIILMLNLNRSSLLRKQRDLEKVLRVTFDGLFEIEKYVHCGKQIIDFVLNNNLAIECNENGHSHISKDKEKEREKYIESQGYTLIKLNPDSNNEYDIFRFINNILVNTIGLSPTYI